MMAFCFDGDGSTLRTCMIYYPNVTDKRTNIFIHIYTVFTSVPAH